MAEIQALSAEKSGNGKDEGVSSDDDDRNIISQQDLEDKIMKEWEEREEADPTCPYAVLGASRDNVCDQTYLETLLDSKIGKYLADEAKEDGVSRIMLSRARRAFDLLSNGALRNVYDQQVIKEVENNCYAKLHFANGYYEGNVNPASMADGCEPVRDGLGITILSNGEKYEGEHAEGKKQGLGLQFWANGDLFLGHWWGDKMSGQGCYMYGNGMRYYGEFLNGRRHGEGRLTWLDGSMYVGQFADGARAGHGTLKLPIAEGCKVGATYKGQWKDNAMHGRGVYTNPRDGRYEGQFRGSHLHGGGRLELNNGDVYEGAFERGRAEGRGRYEWEDGDWLEGTFKASMRDGESSFVSPNRGMRFAGNFHNDEPDGLAALVMETSEGMMEYEGQWNRGLKEGEGVYVWGDGSRYVGQFHKDKMHGAGDLRWNDGSKYKGSFDSDKRHGPGVFKSANGAEQMEMWQSGELVNSTAVETDSPPKPRSGPSESSTVSKKEDEAK